MPPQRGPFTTAPGPRRQLLAWEMWAEDGVVMMLDKATHELHGLSVDSARGRLRVFEDELHVLDLERTYSVYASQKAKLNDQYRHRKMLCTYLSDTIKEALYQGAQSDPEVQKQKIREFYRSRGPNEGGESVDQLMMALFGRV